MGYRDQFQVEYPGLAQLLTPVNRKPGLGFTHLRVTSYTLVTTSPPVHHRLFEANFNLYTTVLYNIIQFRFNPDSVYFRSPYTYFRRH
ncbi:hypothetical protein VN97_g9920 [Penicillium thymicola]|uniref:Uncharacterized protein n=1 Tax=Penicillium thymicola TaxID=293382 RepID=A0AAI9TAG7_PENTH|nr:hypothetical protein VN97_g9920 [Penicillium thymicola]